MPLAFFGDFVQVAEDESKHFTMLVSRLEALGSFYGALPVHGGAFGSGSGPDLTASRTLELGARHIPLPQSEAEHHSRQSMPSLSPR
jgi:hypothetical protein